MKKARYAFAAAGAAPALGLLAPAAVAASAISHAQAGPAKTVKLSHATTPGIRARMSSPSPAPSPQYTCHPTGTVSSGWSKPRHLYQFRILHYGHCVNSQDGKLHAGQTGFSERIRAYSQYGQLIFWARISGHEVSKSLDLFPGSGFTPLNWNPVYEICGAVVSAHTNNVYFGPVCLHP